MYKDLAPYDLKLDQGKIRQFLPPTKFYTVTIPVGQSYKLYCQGEVVKFISNPSGNNIYFKAWASRDSNDTGGSVLLMDTHPYYSIATTYYTSESQSFPWGEQFVCLEFNTDASVLTPVTFQVLVGSSNVDFGTNISGGEVDRVDVVGEIQEPIAIAHTSAGLIGSQSAVSSISSQATISLTQDTLVKSFYFKATYTTSSATPITISLPIIVDALGDNLIEMDTDTYCAGLTVSSSNSPLTCSFHAKNLDMFIASSGSLGVSQAYSSNLDVAYSGHFNAQIVSNN